MLGLVVNPRRLVPAAIVLGAIAVLALVLLDRAGRVRFEPALQPLGGGSPVSVANFRGKPVLLTIWATWCWSCRKELPALATMRRQWQGSPLEIIAVSVDREGAEVVGPMVAQLDLAGLPLYLDPAGWAVRHFALSGLPTTILLDANGREQRRWYGAQAWEQAPVIAELTSALASGTRAAR